VYERHEGVRTGIDFTFGHQDIARLFLRLGEGMSLREASSGLRRSVFRVHDGTTSRQANLAVNYVDAFAPAVIEALHPRVWPAVIVIDATTLMTRGYRPSHGGPTTPDPDRADQTAPEPESRVGNLKAGTILFALDATGRENVPCLIGAQGGKDVESWKAFFASLDGAPAWVVADLDPALGRAVRETWPGAVLYHSRHHIAQLLRDAARADGIPERVELETPIVLSRPIPWSPDARRTRRYGEHPLYAAIALAQRGPQEWAAFRTACSVRPELSSTWQPPRSAFAWRSDPTELERGPPEGACPPWHRSAAAPTHSRSRPAGRRSTAAGSTARR
jgi:hypothetical protein